MPVIDRATTSIVTAPPRPCSRTRGTDFANRLKPSLSTRGRRRGGVPLFIRSTHAIVFLALLCSLLTATLFAVEHHHHPPPSPFEWRIGSAIVPLSSSAELRLCCRPAMPRTTIQRAACFFHAGRRRPPCFDLLWATWPYRKLRRRPLVLHRPMFDSGDHSSIPPSSSSPSPSSSPLPGHPGEPLSIWCPKLGPSPPRLPPRRHLARRAAAGQPEIVGEAAAEKGDQLPYFSSVVGWMAEWAWPPSWIRPGATVSFYLFILIYFNSILNQVQTSEIHRNLIIFNKIINSFPYFEFRHNLWNKIILFKY
jgi:hypothetical protein